MNKSITVSSAKVPVDDEGEGEGPGPGPGPGPGDELVVGEGEPDVGIISSLKISLLGTCVNIGPSYTSKPPAIPEW